RRRQAEVIILKINPLETHFFCVRKVCWYKFSTLAENSVCSDKTVEGDESAGGGRLKEKYGKSCTGFVSNRKAETLIPILLSFIEEGTNIMTDFWAGYNSYLNLIKHI
ncbi:hypothetical protein HZS_6031, partial [Henneguya salminicola]